MLPKIFYGYFEVNACVHSSSTRAAEKLHICIVYLHHLVRNVSDLKEVSFEITCHLHTIYTHTC